MRIAIAQRLTLVHGVRGGMETQAQTLSAGLLARGHELLALTAPHPDGRAFGEEEGVPVRYVAPGSWRWYRQRWWDACYAELAARHRDAPFDALLSHSAGALGYLERAVRELGLPVVVLLHGTQAGELRTRMSDLSSPRGIFRMARFLLRAPDILARWRRVARYVARWIAVAPHVASDARREIGMPAERLVIIPNGVDIERFRPDHAARLETRARLGIDADAPLLIASGRLEREKGFATAIGALEHLRAARPDARLLIAGRGGDAERLRQLARPLGDAVLFVGYVPRTELATLLAAGDMYLMTSACFEGLSLSLVEAMACGLPVLATMPGGGRVVREGVTGQILPVDDSRAWADAIDTMLNNERARRAMGELARQYARAHYSLERMIASTEAALIQAAAKAAN